MSDLDRKLFPSRPAYVAKCTAKIIKSTFVFSGSTNKRRDFYGCSDEVNVSETELAQYNEASTFTLVNMYVSTH
jgi:hypothetical protein